MADAKAVTPEDVKNCAKELLEKATALSKVMVENERHIGDLFYIDVSKIEQEWENLTAAIYQAEEILPE